MRVVRVPVLSRAGDQGVEIDPLRSRLRKRSAQRKPVRLSWLQFEAFQVVITNLVLRQHKRLARVADIAAVVAVATGERKPLQGQGLSAGICNGNVKSDRHAPTDRHVVGMSYSIRIAVTLSGAGEG